MNSSDDKPERHPKGDGTTKVELAKEARLAHEAELAAANQRRDDQRAYVQAIFDGFAKLIPRISAGCALLALIGLAGLAIVYGVPIAIKGLGVDVSTVTTGTTVTTTDGATTTTSSTAATTTGPTPDPATPAPSPQPVVVPRRDDTDAP